MSIIINIFVLAMTKNDIEDLGIDLKEFNNETQTFIGTLRDSRYSEHPKDCKPFHNSDSIKDLIEKVFKEIKEGEPGYDIEPYIVDDRDVGSSIESKYKFLMKEHIRIIDSLSLITKRIQSMGDLLERDFKKSCLVLCCENIPQTLREKLREMREIFFPFLCIHKKSNIHMTRIKFDIHTVNSFREAFGSVLKEVYWGILNVGNPIEERVDELGTRRNISLESTSISGHRIRVK